MTMPNFLIIGAPKSGTTSLYQYLKEHPEIYLPDKKEPHFFSFEGRTQGFNGPSQANFMKKRITKIEDYKKLFEEVNDELAIGEASTSYLYIPEAVERIKKYVPEVKIIAILRHPADRAFSDYLQHWKDGGEVFLDFADALKQEDKRISEGWSPFWQYKGIGFYSVHLKRYFDDFLSEQIRIYLYEDIRDEPLKTVQDIFKFLNVDRNFTPDFSQKYNVSQIKRMPRNTKLHNFLTQDNPIKSFFKVLFPVELRKIITGYIKKKNTVRVSESFKPSLSPQVRQQLLEEYREDILNLQTLIERDLSAWLKY
ncbi:MAG: sulfotransferase [Microcoleaceae cyanobacterium]